MIKNAALLVLAILLAASTVASLYYANHSKNLTAKLNDSETRLAIAQSEIEVRKQALDQSRTARTALEDHLDRIASEADYWRKKVADLSAMEGADEDLNPYERAVLDSLRE